MIPTRTKKYPDECNWDQVDDSFKEEINNEMIASTLWMASQFIQTNKDIEIWIQYVSKVEEIFRIIEGGRQSIALVGEHGFGKMSIVDGIAQLMVEERVPKRLHDKRLVQLSTSALLSGTTMNGAIERLRRMMHEISKAGNIILFINNIHDLVTVGGETEGLDVSEVLAEFLGPGRFLTITSTTTEGYNKHIKKSYTQLTMIDKLNHCAINF
mgnify:CR=1 FL=1